MYFDGIVRMSSHVPMEQRRYLSTLWTMDAYMSNLPEEIDAKELGHSLKDIVKRCYILYKTGTLTRGTECDRMGYWTKTRDRIFHNCFTYTVYKTRTDMALNMELVIYLDNIVEHTDCFDCQERIRASQLTGARLLLHPSATYPRVAEEGINLMPGTMTDIRFNVYEWSMMEPPHGRCSSHTPKSLQFDHINYSYSEEACHAHMEQQQIATTCKCLSQSLPIPTHLKNQGLPMCQALKFPATYDALNNSNHSKQVYFSREAVQAFVTYASCAERVGTGLDSQKTGCRPACIRYTYKPSITAAQWPTKTFMTWSVNKFLQQLSTQDSHARNTSRPDETHREAERLKELRNLLQPYQEVERLTRAGHQKEAIKKLMELQIFERNFLSIVISRPNFDLERVEEKAVVSLTSLFSQIGGLLSIWIGLTFVCIVELVELGINVADTIWNYRQRKLPETAH
ncbi:unnamed protein product [Dicrocoelium dendriticum]|nr:unnamed protein product [Dicrocoelium dendriticum]